jgi:cytochrome c-type biogenesis protein CcmH/NrfF
VYQPALSKSNFLLWFLPYLVLVLGGLIIFFITRKSKHNKD